MELFKEKRQYLIELQELAHSLIKKYNMNTLSTTHIISIIIGDNERLDKITNYLKEKKYFVYGVKEPTVPKGTSRIRIGLSPRRLFHRKPKLLQILPLNPLNKFLAA